MKTYCKYDRMVPISELTPHPKNRNKHTPSQIRRLAKLIDKHGMRAPIVVATAPYNCIAKGHGTLLSLKELKEPDAPVVFQDFASAEELYSFVQSDNAIAAWAELDEDSIRMDLKDLGSDFDMDLLGFDDFQIEKEPSGGIDPDLEWSREIDEKNDYIILLFNDKKDFETAKEKLGLRRVNISLSPTGREDFVTQGLGRIVDGNKIIDRL